MLHYCEYWIQWGLKLQNRKCILLLDNTAHINLELQTSQTEIHKSEELRSEREKENQW